MLLKHLKCPENLEGPKKKRTLQNTFLDNRFSARRLRRSFGAPPYLKSLTNSQNLFRFIFFFASYCSDILCLQNPLPPTPPQPHPTPQDSPEIRPIGPKRTEIKLSGVCREGGGFVGGGGCKAKRITILLVSRDVIICSQIIVSKLQRACRKTSWGIVFLCECMRGLYSHSREYRKIFLRNHFPHIGQLHDGIHLGANTCRACIRTPANTGKYSWRTIYALVSCQGVSFRSCRGFFQIR